MHVKGFCVILNLFDSFNNLFFENLLAFLHLSNLFIKRLQLWRLLRFGSLKQSLLLECFVINGQLLIILDLLCLMIVMIELLGIFDWISSCASQRLLLLIFIAFDHLLEVLLHSKLARST